MADRITRSQKWEKNLETDFLASYDEHAAALFRHCLVRVRDSEAATDIVQETFARAWRYLAEAKSVEYMRAFLYRIANNLIVDASRRKRSSSLDVMIEQHGFEPRDETAKDPAEIPQAREATAFLSSLDEIYRTAITMRFLEEMTPKEIARKLGVSENVVSVRIHRGIAMLSTLTRPPRP